jgi:hypothetical protein
MSDENSTYNASQQQYNNLGFQATGALQIRLDTDKVKESFEIHLRGKSVQTIQDAKGKLMQVEIKIGEPLVNDVGLQAVMGWMDLVINAQVIQGNFITEEDFGEYMMNLRKDFEVDMMINRHSWGVSIRDFPGLSAKFMNCAYLILTRPIFNKERDGMNSTVRTVESVQNQTRGGGFSMPFFGGKK